MKCPRCNGNGSVPYHIADDLFDETNCPLCGGSGEVMTEQEYLQSCNTEQLAEWLVEVTQYCFECGIELKNCVNCPFGKCIDKGWAVEWLKEQHHG